MPDHKLIDVIVVAALNWFYKDKIFFKNIENWWMLVYVVNQKEAKEFLDMVGFPYYYILGFRQIKPCNPLKREVNFIAIV